MKLKAVLFDLGGTLIKTVAIPEIYRRILAAYGFKVSSDELLKAYRANEEELDVCTGQIELGYAFWTKWNLKILDRIGVKGNAEFLAMKINELWWDNADLELYPDVINTMTQLKAKKISVGVVTNALEKDYEQILQRLKVADFFDVVVGIDSCRSAKPDSRIFIYALNQLGVTPEETLFIGDDFERDYLGALHAGLKSLLIDREKRSINNVKTITSLDELIFHLDY